MDWDLGVKGMALLVAMSAAFGVAAFVLVGLRRDTTRWLAPIAAAAFFVGGLLTSEWWFGWATEEDLQPNVDGLSVDETLLFGVIAGVVAVVVTKYADRNHHHPHHG